MIKSLSTYLLLTLFLILMVFVGCVPQTKMQKHIITVSIEPERYFVEQIVGNKKIKVETMVPKNSNPENYDPAPKQIVNLNESESYFEVGSGLGFENAWMQKIMKDAPHLLIFNSSIGIKETANKDPHVWESTVNANIIAENTCRMLMQLDKNNETYYIQQTIAFKKKLKDLNDSITNILKNGDKAFVIYHPSLTYFARDYKLKQLAIEENGKSPSPAQLQSVIESAKKNHVRIVFVQKEFDVHNAEIVAKAINAKIVTIDPLSYSWDKQMIYIANQLKH